MHSELRVSTVKNLLSRRCPLYRTAPSQITLSDNLFRCCWRFFYIKPLTETTIGLEEFIAHTVRPVVAQGHECVTVNATGCGFDPHPRK